jgi:hypothetical protein
MGIGENLPQHGMPKPALSLNSSNLQTKNLRGHVNFHFAGPDVLHIDDLCISDSVMFEPWFWFGGLSFPPLQWRTENFRNRGIGTAMIAFLVGFARSHSAKRIEGEIKPHDSKENQDLPNWYRRRGFTVSADGKTECGAKISLAV